MIYLEKTRKGVVMETFFTIALLALVLLFYFSDSNNKINRWCSYSAFIFWLGVAKEAVYFNLLPYLLNTYGIMVSQEKFMVVYSIATWVLYSLAMPTLMIFSLYFCDFDKRHEKRMKILRWLIYIPGLISAFFFPPFDFRRYQLGSLPFWIFYSIYNLSQGAAYAYFMVKGIMTEKSKSVKKQKIMVAILVVPPVIFWMLSLFLTHPFKRVGLFKLWQGNAFILLGCVIIYILIAFKDGFMGLKLSKETFRWNSDLNICRMTG